MIEVDGQTYESAADVWDLGTLECVKVEEGNVRHYNALDGGNDDYIRTHAPKYVGANSQIFCLDSGSVWLFHKKSCTWHKI